MTYTDVHPLSPHYALPVTAIQDIAELGHAGPPVDQGHPAERAVGARLGDRPAQMPLPRRGVETQIVARLLDRGVRAARPPGHQIGVGQHRKQRLGIVQPQLAQNQPRGGERRGGHVACLSAFFLRIASWKRSAQPGLTSCSPRTRRSSPSPTSRVTALPAPTIASRPIRTGATSALFDPMKAFSPISVRYLK